MAITTVDGLVAGMLPPAPWAKTVTTAEAAGILHSLFYVAGTPGAAVAPSPGLAGAALTSYAGQLPFPAAVGGKSVYLAGLAVGVVGSSYGGVLLLDRLWHNSGLAVTTTTAQTVNSVAWPARDRTGTTDGDGVQVAIEVSTATTNAGAITNTTMSYTNQAGTSGRTATIASFPATGVAGTFVPFNLAAGDTGVRSIQSVTLGTSYGGGAIHLVAYRVIADIPAINNSFTQRDGVQLGLPVMYDQSVPFPVILPVSTSLGGVSGRVLFAQG